MTFEATPAPVCCGCGRGPEVFDDLLNAAKMALNFIENTEGEHGIHLMSGDELRLSIAKATGETP